MIIIDYRRKEQGVAFAYITDIDEIPDFLDWIKRLQAKMIARGKKSDSVIDIRSEDEK